MCSCFMVVTVFTMTVWNFTVTAGVGLGSAHITSRRSWPVAAGGRTLPGFDVHGWSSTRGSCHVRKGN